MMGGNQKCIEGKGRNITNVLSIENKGLTKTSFTHFIFNMLGGIFGKAGITFVIIGGCSRKRLWSLRNIGIYEGAV